MIGKYDKLKGLTWATEANRNTSTTLETAVTQQKLSPITVQDFLEISNLHLQRFFLRRSVG